MRTFSAGEMSAFRHFFFKEIVKIKKTWFFFILFSLAFLYSNLMRISGVVILPPLAESLGISASMVGFLSTLFFYTYGASFAVWGTVADRIGPFRTCGISLATAAAASAILAQAQTPLWIGIGRALSGLGLSSAFTSIMLYSALSFSREKYSVLVGIIMMIGHSGTVLAIAPLGAALDAFGPSGVYYALAFTAFVIGGLLLAFRKYDPVAAEGKKDERPVSLSRFLSDLKTGALIILGSFPLLVVVLTWVTSSASISTLQGLWAVSWVQTTTGGPVAVCRACATWISIGMVIGPFAGGFIVKRVTGNKTAFLIMCTFTQLSWISWMVVSFFTSGYALLGLSGFFMGFFSGAAFVFMGNTIRELAPPKWTGTVLGLLNLMIYGLLIIFQWGTGFVLDAFPSDPASGLYSQTAYQIGFGLILVIQGYSFYLITRVKTFEA